MTTYLLDVNVLIALIDPTHVEHDRVHDSGTRSGLTRSACRTQLSSPPLQLSSHGRVTDAYLLALAHSNGGRLAALDHELASELVPDRRSSLELL